MPEVEELRELLDGLLGLVLTPLDEGPTANVRLLLRTEEDESLETLEKFGTIELDKLDEATTLVLLKVVFAKTAEDSKVVFKVKVDVLEGGIVATTPVELDNAEDVPLLLELIEELKIGKRDAVGAIADTIPVEELHVKLDPGVIGAPRVVLKSAAGTVELAVGGVTPAELDAVLVSELIRRLDDISLGPVAVKLVEDGLPGEEK
ncbi:uncharacterized protein EKO05_0000039 [Ascochyta rabiei]|nr:uncharacterized protein EKO05_0000039 [Ascochyta rabiei]UPX09348.1 hypothetical protein EKO05_0000039 [Ascochyta rabiei]